MSRQLIFDTSALIAAAKTTVQGRLLLDDVLTYAQVVVPPTVKQETVDQGVGQGYADAHELDVRITTPQTILSLLLRRGYEAQIRRLHDQYQRGDITLRGMARRLGLSYRELYEELEKRSLPI